MPELQVQKFADAVSRGFYGELKNMHPRGKELLSLAIAKRKLPGTYAVFDQRRRGKAMNYDFYDCTPTGSAVIVQQRWTTVTKYGNSSTKNYFLLRRQGRGVVVEDFDTHKAMIVKLAKLAYEWGSVIKTLEEKAKRPWKAYKIVEIRSNDSLWSVFDADFEWALGKCRIEAATANHSGGYYCYELAKEAELQLVKNTTFNRAWVAGKKLALIECEAAGKVFKFDNGKRCVSMLTPKRIIKLLAGHQELTAA